jgi:hypothetical protein
VDQTGDVQVYVSGGSPAPAAAAPRGGGACTVNGVQINVRQRYAKGLKSWLYDLDVYNGSSTRVKVFVSVYGDDGERQNIWEPKFNPGESRTFTTENPMAGPNDGHVREVRWVACQVDRDEARCASACQHPR